MLGSSALGRYALGQTSVVVPVVTGETGVFSLSGQAVLSAQTRIAATGAFTLTGQASLRQFSMPNAAGEFALTGKPVSLARGYRLNAQPFVSTYGRHPLFAALGELPFGGAITGETAQVTFDFRGNNAQFERVAGLIALPGAFTLAWPEVSLLFARYPAKIRLFPRVGRGVRARGAGGGPQIRTSTGSGMRARAFGG